MSSVAQRTLFPWMRRWGILPPLEPELFSHVELRRIARIVRGLCLMSVVFDTFMYFGLREVEALSRTALSAFCIYNISALLLMSLVLTVRQIEVERPRHEDWKWLTPLLCTTVVTWIQLTGTVGSYFMMMAAIQIMLFRVSLGWTVGIAALTTTGLGQSLAFGLEELSLLRPTSLMADPSRGLDSIPSFRVAAITSIVLSYTMTFAAASAAVVRFRAQRREIERVRRDFAGLAEGARQGRLTGTELDRWFVDELLGRGGMGEVYAAHDERGEQVAIKMLYQHLVEDESALARFEREQQAAAHISGNFFPRLIQVARAEDDTPYIVMERLRGEDVAGLLRRRTLLTVDEVIKLARAIAGALDELHARGIIHRDLTPTNVFLMASSDAAWPDLRLLDLGMCKLRDGESALTQSSTIMGTPGYLAPEQVLGQSAQAGPECDVFTFASILYRALTGEPAFPATTLVQAVDQVLHREPPLPSQRRPELSPQVDEVFAKALQKRPEQRYHSAGAFAQALEHALRPLAMTAEHSLLPSAPHPR